MDAPCASTALTVPPLTSDSVARTWRCRWEVKTTRGMASRYDKRIDATAVARRLGVLPRAGDALPRGARHPDVRQPDLHHAALAGAALHRGARHHHRLPGVRRVDRHAAALHPRERAAGHAGGRLDRRAGQLLLAERRAPRSEEHTSELQSPCNL